MRTLEDFKVNPANDRLTVTVVDAPGSGGANHAYVITGAVLENNPTLVDAQAFRGRTPESSSLILFQNGPIAEHGVNGLTQEVLLSIVIDRLRSFQAGPFKSRENALALTKLEEAQHWLLHRTRERMARGVEGRTVA